MMTAEIPADTVKWRKAAAYADNMELAGFQLLYNVFDGGWEVMEDGEPIGRCANLDDVTCLHDDLPAIVKGWVRCEGCDIYGDPDKAEGPWYNGVGMEEYFCTGCAAEL